MEDEIKNKKDFVAIFIEPTKLSPFLFFLAARRPDNGFLMHGDYVYGIVVHKDDFPFVMSILKSKGWKRWPLGVEDFKKHIFRKLEELKDKEKESTIGKTL